MNAGSTGSSRLQKLVQERLERGRTEAPTVSRAPRDGRIPLSFGQERLWFLSTYDPESFAYNCPDAIHLKGSLDVRALEQALNEVVDRHEALRTSFESTGGETIQCIARSLRVELPLRDLTGLPAVDREAEAQSVMRRESQVPFDLARGPLVRARLLRLGPDEYILLWVSHHAVYDGWSAGLFFRDLSELYGALVTGRPPRLPQLAVQYADFAFWERNQPKSEEGLAYWRRQLAGPLPVLQLPSDRVRPPVQTYSGARRIGRLPAATALRLKALARSEGATLFMVLLAAYQSLLARYTGQSDILVGSPFANRPRPEFEHLIGFFANMIVFRGDLSDNPTFRTLIGRVRDISLEALTYQRVPFGQLMEVLQPVRDVSRSPLFQVAFVLQNTPTHFVDIPGVESIYVDVDAGSSRYDLTLSMKETDDGLLHRFEYNTDLFDEGTIVRMEQHFSTLLESVLENPDRRTSELSYLTPEELHQLVVAPNQTRVTVPDRCVHELIDEQAQRTPDREAAVFGRRRVTYSQLIAKADAFALRLRNLGVGPETAVAVCMRRSLEKIVAVLGILKAGGAYVPIDDRSALDRVTYMLADARVRIVVADPDTVVPSSSHVVDVVRLDRHSTRALEGRAWTPPNVLGSHLAYTIYTTGSTGRPKGVQVPHSALVNFLASMRERPGLTADDTVLAITTLTFDIAALEIFLPLTVGARVVLASAEDALSPAALDGLLRASGVTLAQATPTTWRMLVESGWTGRAGLKILCGGESLSRDLADALLSRGKEVWNLYGPTETTVWSSVRRVEPGDDPISIGQPIANTQLYVVDQYLEPVPIGVPGELLIGGRGLARGYLNKPELTAQKFVRDHISHEPGARLYRTGDLVRRLGNGGIQFLGRLDSQVKVRGFRVEPEGVEATLKTHPAVRTAVVVARPDSTGTARLVAYIVPRSARTYVDELRETLRKRLPSYSVPGAFVFLDTLPSTENGKLNREALPEPEASFDPEPAFVSPRDDLERKLAELWCELLGTSAVGVRDSFFDLGGHSLLALRLFASIEHRFGQKLQTATLFESPTIEHLAQALRNPRGRSGSCVVALQPLGSGPPLFCVHGVTGDLLGFQPLARRLAPSYPLFGIQLPADGDGNLTSIEAMASRYIVEVKRVQPFGPYYLGGHSFGGMVAFEMARQLETGGDSVELLAIFDTRRGDFGDGITKWGRLKAAAQNFRHLSGSQRLRYLWVKAHDAFIEWFAPRGVSALSRNRGQDYSHAYTAARSYVQQPYGGKVVLFRADQGLEAYRADRLDWREMARGGVDFVTVSGNHDDMLSPPHIDAIASVLKNRLKWPAVHARTDESRR